MIINVKYLSLIGINLGRSEETFELQQDDTVSDLIEKIIATYGEPFKIYVISSKDGGLSTEKINICLQREGMIRPQKRIDYYEKFDTVLKDQDVVVLSTAR
jgi:molybdopterin converting factor small subunit